MKWINAGELTGKEQITRVNADGKRLCLIQHMGKVYATSARCPHAGADLSDGWCKNGKLVCPVHRYSYDLETGRGSEGQGDYVPTYPVKLEGNEIYVGINSFGDKLKAFFKL